jgi:hypothetical protein
VGRGIQKEQLRGTERKEKKDRKKERKKEMAKSVVIHKHQYNSFSTKAWKYGIVKSK